MGQGGQVKLINHTAQRWTRVHQNSYQMNSWDFPQTIEAGQEVSCYVEWDQGVFTTESDDAGEARYQLDGSGHQFEVRARNTAGFTISAVNLSVPDEQWGYSGEERLGWSHDGTVSLSLPGTGAWMSRLPDSVPLTELNIPGTHDSGTYKIDLRVARCQDLDLEGQLRMGVRFLDVRCRHFRDKFTIHHGRIYADMNFDEVMEACNRFLDALPSETIVMSIRDEYDPEGCTRSYEATFDEYVRRYPRWYLGTAFPRLGDVRGRIVLVRRFEAAAKGIDWGALQIQDNYSPPGIDEKWTDVRNHLDKATVGAATDWYVNFASAVRTDTWPDTFAKAINPRLGADLVVRDGRYGTVLQDYCTGDVVSSVVRSNERLRSGG